MVSAGVTALKEPTLIRMGPADAVALTVTGALIITTVPVSTHINPANIIRFNTQKQHTIYEHITMLF